MSSYPVTPQQQKRSRNIVLTLANFVPEPLPQSAAVEPTIQTVEQQTSYFVTHPTYSYVRYYGFGVSPWIYRRYYYPTSPYYLYRPAPIIAPVRPIGHVGGYHGGYIGGGYHGGGYGGGFGS